MADVAAYHGRSGRGKRAGHLPHAARPSDRRGHVHQRLHRAALRRDARSRTGPRPSRADRDRRDRAGHRGKRSAARPESRGRSRAIRFLRWSRRWSIASPQTLFQSRHPDDHQAASAHVRSRTSSDSPGSTCGDGRGDYDDPQRFARSCAKPASPISSSIRCSCAAARVSAARWARCPASSRCRWTKPCRCLAAKADGVPGVLLFGLPDAKDPFGSAAFDSDAPVQSAVRAIKREVPDLLVITDVCLRDHLTRPLRHPHR